MEIEKIPPQVVPYVPTIPSLLGKCLTRTAGFYYGVLGGGLVVGYTTLAANMIYCMPFMVLAPESFDRIGVSINTGGAGNAHLGIYADDGFKPGTLIVDAGTIDTGTSGDKEIVINQALSTGLYWLAILPNANIQFVSIGIANLLGIGSGTVTTGGNSLIYKTSQAYGDLPTPHPTPAVFNGSCPLIVLRRA